MAQLLIEDLNPILIHQLETLAKLHGRSLQEEIKHILQLAAQSQIRSYHTGGDMAKAREAVADRRLDTPDAPSAIVLN